MRRRSSEVEHLTENQEVPDSKSGGATGWVREGDLWTYQRPPKRKSLAELRKDWQERLGKDASQCPECGSELYEETTKGWWPSEDHYHDPNRRNCCRCGHEWYVTCPTCGHNKGGL